MKSYIYLLAFLGLLAFSCSDDQDPSCDVESAIDMTWLAELIEEEEKHLIGQDYSFLYTGIYKQSAMKSQRRVFIFGNCCPGCLMTPPAVYDCSGEVLGKLGTDGIEWEEITDSEVIWKSSNNSCSI